MRNKYTYSTNHHNHLLSKGPLCGKNHAVYFFSCLTNLLKGKLIPLYFENTGSKSG